MAAKSAKQTNPLLEKENKHRLKAVPFDKIKTEHFLPAFEAAISEAQTVIDAIKNSKAKATFENTILAMDDAEEHLDYIASIYFNLLSAESDGEFKALAQKISPMLAEFGSKISTDPKIFARIKAVYDKEVAGKPEPKLPSDLSDKDYLIKAERYRIIERTYTSFIRNGALLSDEDKAKLTAIDMELSTLSPKFSDNILNATNAFELHLTARKEVKGIPESALAAAAFLAKKKGKDKGWLFNLQPSSMIPVLTYCKDREIRKTLQKAYASRAFKGKFDNRELIKKILELRYKRAKLLGFKNHAEYVLKERMAGSPKAVLSFLDKIYKVAYPAAKKEVAETKAFALKTDKLDKMMPWDFGYYSNKLKEKLFDYDPEALRPWFKVENVVEGLFKVAKKIYGIDLKRVKDVPVYHKDVQTWEVHDHGKYMGLLYLDLFPRETKRGGAWMTTFQGQGLFSDGQRRPHVSIVGSLTPSTDDQPSLLRLDEARTIFHEFGHALHALLSDCHYRGVSGARVLWDFVELPSQIMENWLMEKEALNLFAKHYQTGEPLPEELLNKVIAAKNFQAGVANINQLRYASMDMQWHSSNPGKIEDVSAFEKEAIAPYKLLPAVAGTCISTAFAHIFAGGYSAGYYSYKWAEALEADAWSAFTEHGIFDPATAKSFRENILARGNSFHPMQLFTAFRGRKPDPDALLKRDGLI